MYDYEDSYEETGIDESVVQDALFGINSITGGNVTRTWS